MNQKGMLIIAILAGLIVRILLVGGAQGISLGGYETQVHVQHIQDTGLPMITNNLGWLGGETKTMPVFYYLLAFIALFIPLSATLLYVPNIIMALIPLPVWLLTRQISKNQVVVTTITLASAFLPLMYKDTLTAAPITLALFLLLMSFHYFLRLDKTPKDQTIFAVCTVLLTLTHALSIILLLAMAFTLLIAHIQRIKFSKALAEATIFTTFLVVWANGIVYKEALREYGLQTFSIGSTIGFTSASVITTLGVISLIGGVFGMYVAITQEKNLTAHAIIALALASLLALILRILRPHSTILILSICMLLLSTIALEQLFIARRRSRIPGLHITAFIGLIGVFILTSAIPAIAVGVESYSQVPGPAEEQVIKSILETKQLEVTLWDVQHGYYLEAAGIPSRIDTNLRSVQNSLQIVEQVESIDSMTSEIRIIELLNTYKVEILVLPQSHSLPLGERCFQPLLDRAWEVYRVRCVVQ